MRETTNPYSVVEHSVVEHLGAGRRAAPGASRVRIWLLVGLLGCAGLTARVLLASRAAVQAGEAALARADQTAARRSFQRAVRLYVPASPFVAKAVGQLRGLAEGAAATGDAEGERHALLALRAGLLGARSLYVPHADQLAWVNDRLAAGYAAGDPAGSQWHRERLSQTPGPGLAPAACLLIGFVLWSGAALLFTRRGINRTLALRRPWAIGCALVFTLGLTLFVGSLWLA